MVASPIPLPISGAAFDDIRSQLDQGFGYFVDGPFAYVALDMSTHHVNVLLRKQGETFTDCIQRQPVDVRVAINGQRRFRKSNGLVGISVTA